MQKLYILGVGMLAAGAFVLSGCHHHKHHHHAHQGAHGHHGGKRGHHDCQCGRRGKRGKWGKHGKHHGKWKGRHGKWAKHGWGMRGEWRHKMMKMKMKMMRRHKRRGIGSKAVMLLGHAPIKKLEKKVGLTADQVKRLQAARKGFRDRMAQLRLDHKRIKAKLKVEWLKDRPSPQALRAIFKPVYALKSTKMKAKLEHAIALSKIVTPAQWKKLLVMKRRRGWHQKGWHGGKKRGWGGKKRGQGR